MRVRQGLEQVCVALAHCGQNSRGAASIREGWGGGGEGGMAGSCGRS